MLQQKKRAVLCVISGSAWLRSVRTYGVQVVQRGSGLLVAAYSKVQVASAGVHSPGVVAEVCELPGVKAVRVLVLIPPQDLVLGTHDHEQGEVWGTGTPAQRARCRLRTGCRRHKLAPYARQDASGEQPHGEDHAHDLQHESMRRV